MLLPLPLGTERKLSRCWRPTSSSPRRPAGSGPAGSARRSSAMPAGYLSRAMAPGRCCATSRRWWRSGSSPAGAAPRPWRTCPLTSTVSSPCGWPGPAVAGMPLPKSAARSSRCWRWSCPASSAPAGRTVSCPSAARCRGSSSTWPPSAACARNRSRATGTTWPASRPTWTRSASPGWRSCRRRSSARSSPGAPGPGWPGRRCGPAAGCCACSSATRTARGCWPPT